MKDFFKFREEISEARGDFPNRFQKNVNSKKFERYVAWNALHRFGVKEPKDMTKQKENEIHNFMSRDPQQKGFRRWDQDILGDSVYEVIYQIRKTGYRGLLKKGDM